MAKYRNIPNSTEAEISFLGSIMIDPDSLDRELDHFLKPEDFYNPAHGKIYSAMMALLAKSQPIDLPSLKEQLKLSGDLERIGGVPYLTHLAATVGHSGSINAYARIIHEKSYLRKMLSSADSIIGMVDVERPKEEILEVVEAEILSLGYQEKARRFSPIQTVMKETMKKVEAIQESPDKLTGLTTGYIDLDRLTAGLHPGELTILAARPSMGKTALALNIAINSAFRGEASVGIFSLEMSNEQLMQRIISAEAKVDSYRMRTGCLSDQDWVALLKANRDLSKVRVFIDDTGAISIMEMRTKARRLKRQGHLDLLVVDYLQLVRADTKETREREVSEISQNLKALAKELNIPVLALSQLNRTIENRPNKRPQLSDLRESGSIEQDADNVLFIYRPGVYDDEADSTLAEIIVGKQRNGPIGGVELTFLSKFTRFENRERRQTESGQDSIRDHWLTERERKEETEMRT